jgi:hypothetical protein
VGSNAGATKRHMFWSHPKPCTKTIGRPSAGPDTRTFSWSALATATA